MAAVHLFIALLGAAVLLSLLARPLAVPDAVVLVVGGLALGALPFAPDAAIEPDLVLLVFLPPILFPAALTYAREDVATNVRAVGFLAIGLVLATIATVAVVTHVVLGLPWAVGFTLGAILGPTDPVAATSILRRAGAPERIAVILEGESLVNDATALTAFRIAVVAVGGSFALGTAALQFAGVAVGGAAIGAVLGWAVAQLLARIDEVEVESAIALLCAYGAYVLAEEVGVSGILATVAAGFVLGRRLTEVTSPETRLHAGSFWLLLRFLAESMLFVLVGVVFADVLGHAQTRGTGELLAGTALVSAVLVGTRLLWLLTVPYLIGFVGRGDSGPTVPPRALLVLSAGGLRGAVSVAVALAIPAQVAGVAFPERDTVIVLVLGAVAVTLIGPALALPPLIRALGLARPDALADREAHVREHLAEAAIARAEELAAQGEVSDELLERVRDVYEARVARLREEETDTTLEPATGMSYAELLRALVGAERDALHRLEDRGEVAGEVLREVEHDLDLAERRFDRGATGSSR